MDRISLKIGAAIFVSVFFLTACGGPGASGIQSRLVFSQSGSAAGQPESGDGAAGTLQGTETPAGNAAAAENPNDGGISGVNASSANSQVSGRPDSGDSGHSENTGGGGSANSGGSAGNTGAAPDALSLYNAAAAKNRVLAGLNYSFADTVSSSQWKGGTKGQIVYSRVSLAFYKNVSTVDSSGETQYQLFYRYPYQGSGEVGYRSGSSKGSVPFASGDLAGYTEILEPALSASDIASEQLSVLPDGGHRVDFTLASPNKYTSALKVFQLSGKASLTGVTASYCLSPGGYIANSVENLTASYGGSTYRLSLSKSYCDLGKTVTVPDLN